MPASDLLEALRAVPGVVARATEPMERHLPLRVGGPAELWVIVPDLDALRQVLAAARATHTAWRVHWPLEDWVVREGGIPGLVLRPGRGFEVVEPEGDHIRIGAGALWSQLAALGEGWWSALASWPGSVGALLAGDDRGWLAGSVARLRLLKGRSVETVALEGRDPIPEVPPTAVPIDLELRPAIRAVPTPHRSRPRPPGTLFADPAVPGPDGSAAGLLARTGVTGSRLRQWRLSTHEPGTLVQLGGGGATDALLLARGVAQRVERLRGLSLDTRLPVLGRDATRTRRPLLRGEP